jgi:proteic killer suppression protein
MIQSFKARQTQRFFEAGTCPRQWRAFEDVAARKLDLLNRVVSVGQLAIPPGNHLEKLKGELRGRWSIRINDQWRICFKWDDGDIGPSDVEIIDCH